MAKLAEKNVIQKIDEMSGNLTMVSRAFNVSRPTMYKFVHGHPRVADALDAAREKMIDNVESALYNQALSGNTVAMIFFLKTQGKKRGYIERQEIAGPDGGMLQIEYVNKPYPITDVPSEPGQDTPESK